MILVTVLKKQGVSVAVPYDLAIDPEKIVNTRVLDGVTQIDYAETFDRNREEITYEVTAAKPNIDATITGDYSSHTLLNLVVCWSDNKDLIPFPAISSTYTLSMQEKYIVDIQDVPFELYWKNQKISTTVRKVRFVPGAFKQEVIYVTNHLHDLVDNTPSETTTTTTAVPVTTTTTEMATTTTTIEPSTTTTTEVPDLCQPLFYKGTMTVGGVEDVTGYLGGEGGIGTINPLENDLTTLIHQDNTITLALVSGCYDHVFVYIDGFGYELTYETYAEGVYQYILSGIITSPFPPVGETCNIQICFGDACTTTTTELGTTTTTPVQ